MSKIFFVANHPFTLSNFRAKLIGQISELGHDLCALFPFDQNDPYVKKQFKNLPVKLIPIFLSRRGLNPLIDFISFFKLYFLYKREKPQIVLNYTIKPNIYSGLAAVLAGVPKVYSNITGLGFLFIDFEKASFFKALIRGIVCRLYRVSLSKQNGVFFQNSDDLNFFIDKKIVKENNAYLINGSGVDLTFFTPNFDIAKKKNSFVFVGRLLKDKGIQELVDATKLLIKRGHHFNLTVIGGLDENPSSVDKAQIETWKQEPNIKFLGHLEDVREELSKSEILVLPSYREGTPKSVLEAMAMGLAIITTDVPGCRETVIPGKNGILVAPKNHFALAQAMEQFIKHPHMAEEMGLESRVFAAKKFDVNKINEDIASTVLG